MLRRTFLASAAAASTAVAAPPRCRMGIAATCYLTVWRPKDSFQFLEHCDALGAGGVQTPLTSFDPEYLKKFRARAGQSGMYVEVMAPLPKGDLAVFERTIQAAKAVGADRVRAGALAGRRYETFSTLDEWKSFVAESKAAIERAVPVLERNKVRMALENHKDWTVEEHVALLKSYNSEYLGALIDTGNNISLLDDPMQVIRELAPFAVATHVKDMGVNEYPEGFLLSEMPLGDGMLDMQAVIDIIRKARPDVRMTLETITRDPLKIPVLTEKYWATFPDRKATRLAATMAMVRKKKMELPGLAGLGREMQLRLEDDNVKRSLHYGRTRLGL